MRRFLIKLALLFVIIVFLDTLIGKTMDYVVNSITVGSQARDNYICNEMTDDIVIFGSSRASHHYNAKLIEEAFCHSCYNCGEDGNGIILAYGRLKMAQQRYNPKFIIYDVNPQFDLYVNDNSKYLGWLKPRYKTNDVEAKIFDRIDPMEKIKMQSGMYVYNSRFLQSIVTYLTSYANEKSEKGFRPKKGSLDPMKLLEDGIVQDDDIKIDSLKLSFLEELVNSSKGSTLCFVVSPIWYGMNENETRYIKNMCAKYQIPFFDFSNDTKYVHNDKFFCDGTHMNEKGANEFTHDLIVKLQSLINN